MLWRHLRTHTPGGQFSIVDRLLLARPSFANALNLVTAFLAFNSARQARRLSARGLQSAIGAAHSHAFCSANRATLSALNVPAGMQVSNDVSPTPSADEAITPSRHTLSNYVNLLTPASLGTEPFQSGVQSLADGAFAQCANVAP